jgi:hypothetical protein
MILTLFSSWFFEIESQSLFLEMSDDLERNHECHKNDEPAASLFVGLIPLLLEESL